MHSFRTGGDEWFRHLGLQSSGHGPQQPIQIEFTAEDHPITRNLQDWKTGNEELYNNVKLFGAKPLAMGKQKILPPTPELIKRLLLGLMKLKVRKALALPWVIIQKQYKMIVTLTSSLAVFSGLVTS